MARQQRLQIKPYYPTSISNKPSHDLGMVAEQRASQRTRESLFEKLSVKILIRVFFKFALILRITKSNALCEILSSNSVKKL